MKNKSVLFSLILSLTALLSLTFAAHAQAAEVGNEIFCQLDGGAFLAKTFSPNQIYSCRMPASHVSSGETLDLDIVVSGSLQLMSVKNSPLCQQIPRPGIGMTVECTNDGKNNPIETVDLNMTINASTGPEGSIAVSGHLKDDLNTLATTKFKASFAQAEAPVAAALPVTVPADVKNAAPTDTTTTTVTSPAVTTTTTTTPSTLPNLNPTPVTTPAPSGSWPWGYIVIIVLALLGVVIGTKIAFKKEPEMPMSMPMGPVSLPPQPPVSEQKPSSSEPQNQPPQV